jgi:hypothetical protein
LEKKPKTDGQRQFLYVFNSQKSDGKVRSEPKIEKVETSSSNYLSGNSFSNEERLQLRGSLIERLHKAGF